MPGIWEIVKKWTLPYGISTLGVSSRNFWITYLEAFISASLINQIQAKAPKAFIHKLLIFFACLAFFIVLDAFSLYVQQSTVHKMVLSLRQHLLGKAMKAPILAVDQIGGRSEILSRMNQDIQLTSTLLSSGMLSLFMYLISGIGATVSIALVDWRFALFLYLLGDASLAAYSLLGPLQRSATQRKQEQKAGLLSIFSESLTYFIQIKLMGIQNFVKRLFDNKVSQYKTPCRTEAKVAAGGKAVGAVDALFQYMGIIILGLFFYQKGYLTLGQVVFLAQLGTLILTMVTSMGAVILSLQKSMAGVYRLNQFLLLPEEDLDGAETCWAAASQNKAIQNECYFIEPFQTSILFPNGTRLFLQQKKSIKPKGIIGIKGESGVGKSTFFRLLLGIYPEEEGQVKLWGKKLSSYGKGDLRKQVTYVPQENLISQGTIRENLLLNKGNGIPEAKLDQAVKAVCAEGWIRDLGGYDAYLEEGGKNLSGGQRQCLAIARGLVRDTKLLLLDEAFAGIDEKRKGEIFRNVRKWTKTNHSTVLLITHDQMLMDSCDDMMELKSFLAAR